MGFHQKIHPRLTPSRKRWMRRLLKGPADPAAHRTSRTQSDCVKLGWAERGAMFGEKWHPFNYQEITAHFGDRYWEREDFKGYWDCITPDGRIALQLDDERLE